MTHGLRNSLGQERLSFIKNEGVGEGLSHSILVYLQGCLCQKFG